LIRSRTFGRLAGLVRDRIKLVVEHVLVAGDWAVVELRADAVAKNGVPFDNRYCWVTRMRDDRIVEVRAYLDSALVARLVEGRMA
jgi:ketosteroid isomerase-like protein